MLLSSRRNSATPCRPAARRRVERSICRHQKSAIRLRHSEVRPGHIVTACPKARAWRTRDTQRQRQARGCGLLLQSAARHEARRTVFDGRAHAEVRSVLVFQRQSKHVRTARAPCAYQAGVPPMRVSGRRAPSWLLPRSPSKPSLQRASHLPPWHPTCYQRRGAYLDALTSASLHTQAYKAIPRPMLRETRTHLMKRHTSDATANLTQGALSRPSCICKTHTASPLRQARTLEPCTVNPRA